MFVANTGPCTSAHATIRCDSGKNKTQTFSKREQISSSVPHECPASVQSVTRVYPTTCHTGWDLAGHSRSVRLGYEDNKTRLLTPIRSKTPAFQLRCLHLGAGRERSRSTLRGDDCCWKKGAIEKVPPAQSESGFYSRYFLVPKKDGGLWPIFDLRLPESRPHEKVIQDDHAEADPLADSHRGLVLFSGPERRILSHPDSPPLQTILEIRLRGSGLPVHGPTLWTVSGPPHFYEVHGRGSFPSKTDGNPHSQLRRRLAHSGPVRGEATFTQNPPPQPLGAPGAQGQFRQERTVSQPTSIVPGNSSRLSSHESCDSARTRSGHSETRGHLQERHRSPTQSVSENAVPHGRSIASATAGPAPQAAPSTLVETTALAPWKNPRWMEKGVAMGLVCNRKVVTTDASNTGWGALCEGKPTFSHWSKAEKGFHINCLEMLAVCRACQFFLPDLIGCHVLLEWAQLNLRLLRAAHLPGRLNQGADIPSEEWMLHPQMVQGIWKIFGKAEVDLFASKDSSHCPTYYSKVRDALAHDWPNLLLYAFPPITLLPQVIRHMRKQGHKVLLVAPLWENQPWLSELTQLLTAAPWPVPLMMGSPLSGERNNMAPSTRAVGSPPLAARREPISLPERVLNTISEARAPSTRRLYTLKWSVFSTWCLDRGENASTSELAVVLSFLQELLDKGRSHSTLRVFVAAIAAFHASIAGQSVGRDNSVVRFLRGAKRLNPPRPLTVPTWDLPTVLRALKGPPFTVCEPPVTFAEDCSAISTSVG